MHVGHCMSLGKCLFRSSICFFIGLFGFVVVVVTELYAAAAAKSLQSCPTLCDPTRLPRPWDSPGKNTGVVCHFLLQCMKGKSESVTVRDPMVCGLPGLSYLYILEIKPLSVTSFANIFSQSFHFVFDFLSCAKPYKFD